MICNSALPLAGLPINACFFESRFPIAIVVQASKLNCAILHTLLPRRLQPPPICPFAPRLFAAWPWLSHLLWLAAILLQRSARVAGPCGRQVWYTSSSRSERLEGYQLLSGLSILVGEPNLPPKKGERALENRVNRVSPPKNKNVTACFSSESAPFAARKKVPLWGFIFL